MKEHKVETGLHEDYGIYGITIKEDADPRLVVMTQDSDTIVFSKKAVKELIGALEELQNGN